ncbi:DapH/DapD/GlmU-related protein [Skermania sp. ID1734]|uniref:acyltransferase n=1 Tax=Skermania sp. ID1734 TaxID=2597516 RepID=UPI002101DDD8|nr:acyltransferase [Skermania sp. ID1734]
MRIKVIELVLSVLRDIILNSILASPLVHPRIRVRVLRLVGHDVDPSAAIGASGFIGAWRGLVVGPGAGINRGFFFDLGAQTVIGAGAGLGYDVMVITCTHDLGASSRRWGKDKKAAVRIGAGSWIGARVTIMPGVTIGEGCVVAAGSVVVEDCLPNSLYAGVPAKWKAQLPDVPKTSADEVAALGAAE